MKEFVAFELDDSANILIEVDESEHERGVSRVARQRDGVVVDSAQKFEQVADSVRPVANAFMGKILDLDIRPDSVSIEFGIKVTYSAGAVIASAGGEANFKVSMTWVQSSEEKSKL